MLCALRKSAAPDLRLDPQLRGWHALFIGTWRAKDDPDPGARTMVKLASDPDFIAFEYDDQRRKGYRHKGQTEIVECFWKYADLTGEQIVISHSNRGILQDSWVTHFRFVPLTPQQVESLLEDRRRQDTKRLFATHDIHGIFFLKSPNRARDFTEEFEPYRHSDVGKVMVEYITDPMGNFPDQPNSVDPNRLLMREGDENLRRSLAEVRRLGIDFYQHIFRRVREMGCKVYLGLRMNHFVSEPPWDANIRTEFHAKNRELCCRDIDDSEVGRMSYAYPQVQEMVIATLKRMLDMQPDGVHLLFCRGVPNLLYEPPLWEGFKQQSGKDPRQLPEEDPGFLRFRCEVFNQFMRRLRRELDAHADSLRQGWRPSVAAYVLHDKRTNEFFALDPATWTAEGLVDDLVIYPKVMREPGTFYDTDEPVDTASFAELVRGTQTKLYIELLPRSLEPGEARQKAIGYYRDGAHGLSLWDTYSRVPKLRQWSMFRRLGHAAELPHWTDGEGEFFRYLPVHSLGGVRIDKYSPAYGR